MWLIDSGWEEGIGLEGQMQRILSSVTDDLAVWTAIAERHHIDMFCGADASDTNPGFYLETGTIRMLADRSIAFQLSIYLDSEKVIKYLDQWGLSGDFHPATK